MRLGFVVRGRRVALASVAIFAIAGGIAYAAIPDAGTGAYHACLVKGNGMVRIIDPAQETCRPNETAITFGAKGDQGIQGIQGPAGSNGTNGTNGSNGVSPTVAQLRSGDEHCPAGGAAITDAAGVTAYVCSGANGRDGTNGTNGTNGIDGTNGTNGTNGSNGVDGQPFSGTFTSQNGEYSISVTDTGVRITSLAGASIVFTNSDISMHSKGTAFFRSDSDFTVMGSSNVTMRAASNLTLKGDAATTLQGGGALSIKGASVGINGGISCLPAIRSTDFVSAADAATGQVFVTHIGPGSSTVCIGG